MTVNPVILAFPTAHEMKAPRQKKLYFWSGWKKERVHFEGLDDAKYKVHGRILNEDPKNFANTNPLKGRNVRVLVQGKGVFNTLHVAELNINSLKRLGFTPKQIKEYAKNGTLEKKINERIKLITSKGIPSNSSSSSSSRTGSTNKGAGQAPADQGEESSSSSPTSSSSSTNRASKKRTTKRASVPAKRSSLPRATTQRRFSAEDVGASAQAPKSRRGKKKGPSVPPKNLKRKSDAQVGSKPKSKRQFPSKALPSIPGNNAPPVPPRGSQYQRLTEETARNKDQK